MKFCPNCNAANEDSTLFCTACGTALSENTAAPAQPVSPQPYATDVVGTNFGAPAVQVKKKGKIGIIILAVILAIVAVAVIGSNMQEAKKRRELIEAVQSDQTIASAVSIFKSSMSEFSPKAYFDEDKLEYVFEVTVSAVSASDVKNASLRSAWQTVVTNNVTLANTLGEFFEEYEGVDVVCVTYSKHGEELLVIRNGKIEFNAAN